MMKLSLFSAATLLLLTPVTLEAAGKSAEALSAPCNACHGPDGVSHGDAVPSIAGMSAEYMTEAMLQFKEGRRSATIMNRIAKGYKEYELRKIARYFASKDWQSVPSTRQDALVVRGRQLHEQYCAECHEDSGRYQDKDMPRLAGQKHHYLLIQLRLYQKNEESLPQPSEMAEKLAEIPTEDLPALSAFYSTLP